VYLTVPKSGEGRGKLATFLLPATLRRCVQVSSSVRRCYVEWLTSSLVPFKNRRIIVFGVDIVWQEQEPGSSAVVLIAVLQKSFHVGARIRWVRNKHVVVRHSVCGNRFIEIPLLIGNVGETNRSEAFFHTALTEIRVEDS